MAEQTTVPGSDNPETIPVAEGVAMGQIDAATAASEDSLVAIIDRVADPTEDSRWDLSTKRTVLVILLVVLVFILYISRDVLPMVLVAAILAYLLNPIVNLLHRLRIPRPLGTVVVYVTLIGLLALLPIIFVPMLIDQLRSLARFDVPNRAFAVLNWANTSIKGLPEVFVVPGVNYTLPVHELVRQLQTNSQQTQFVPSVNDILSYIQQALATTTNVVSSTATIGFNVVGGIMAAFVAIVVTFVLSVYLTMDAPRIQTYFQSLFPASYQSELAVLLRRIGQLWQSFLRGQLILSISVGVATGIALSLVGMPGALIFALLAGLLEVVPNLGPVLSMIPAVITALIQGSSVLGPMGINNLAFALIVVGIYFVIQQLEAHILVPRIIGDSINVHPVIVICAVVVGFSLGGILGALLAPPVVGTFRVIGGYVHAKLLDKPPFPDARKRKPPNTYRRTLSGRELETAKGGRSQVPTGAHGSKRKAGPSVQPADGIGVSELDQSAGD